MGFFTLLQAAGEAAQSTNGGAGSASSTMGFLTTVVPFLLIIAIFYFFLIRPQSKKQKETEKMIEALKKGDKIVTIGGVHGVISSTKEKTVIVKVDDNCKIEFSKTAIAGLDAAANPITNKNDEKVTEKKDAKTNKSETNSKDTKDSKESTGDKPKKSTKSKTVTENTTDAVTKDEQPSATASNEDVKGDKNE